MSVRPALLYSFASRYASLVIQFAATVVIARLLSPSEIGIYSVGAAVVMIANTLRDFGTSTYVIQEKELTDDRLRTAFTITVGLAWIIASVLWILSSPLSAFYAEPGVAEVLRVIAFNFVLIPFGSITLAMLRRDMNFRALMYITLAGTLAHSATAVALAALGMGFISLAWAAVCGTAATVVGAALANRQWIFARFSLIEQKRVLGFGMRSSLSSMASEAGHASPEMVLGRTLGMEATGLFSRAMGYVQLFERLLQDVLRGVMLPYFSDEARAGTNLRKKLNVAIENIGAISWFIIAMTAVLAKPMILLLYGSQWTDAVPIAQILCVAMAIRCLSPTLASALVANGHISLVMRATLGSTLAKFVLLIALSPYGLGPAAAGFTLAEGIGFILILRATRIADVFSFSDFFRICYRTLPLTLMGVVPALTATLLLPSPEGAGSLAVFVIAIGGASSAVWLTTIWLADRPPKQEMLRAIVFLRNRIAARTAS